MTLVVVAVIDGSTVVVIVVVVVAVEVAVVVIVVVIGVARDRKLYLVSTSW